MTELLLPSPALPGQVRTVTGRVSPISALARAPVWIFEEYTPAFDVTERKRRKPVGLSPPTGFLLACLCARGDLNPHALAGTGT
jgi:hypothetical protein